MTLQCGYVNGKFVLTVLKDDQLAVQQITLSFSLVGKIGRQMFAGRRHPRGSETHDYTESIIVVDERGATRKVKEFLT